MLSELAVAVHLLTVTLALALCCVPPTGAVVSGGAVLYLYTFT